MEQSLFKYILYIIKKYFWYFLGILIMSFGIGASGVFCNFQIKNIIDAMTNKTGESIIFLSISIAAYEFSSHAFAFVFRLLNLKYKPDLAKDTMVETYKITIKHNLHWFDSNLSGEITSKTADFSSSIINLVDSIPICLCFFLRVLVNLIIVYYINCTAMLIILAYIILFFTVSTTLFLKLGNLQQQCTTARQEAIGNITDSISNVFSIKVIGDVFSELKNKIFPATDKYKMMEKKVQKFETFYIDVADAVISISTLVAQMYLLATMLNKGTISIGDFAFIAVVTIETHTYVSILRENILGSIVPNMATINACYNFIKVTKENKELEEGLKLHDVKGLIKFENVKFSYDEKVEVFQNLSLEIQPGEKVGIVGYSAAGKSTLIKCLLKYFKVQGGRISVDGFDISQVTEGSLRANISIIPQDINLFHRTILENILIAKEGATMDEVEMACIEAQIHDDILKMPDKYNTIVGERGLKLSGGQRQRIAIARAILKNSPILILDEATSALDTPTEQLIQQAINNLLKITKSTTIIIAHRLSTLMNADRIIVMEKGKIIQEGKHTDLSNIEGLYKCLWDTQIGKFTAVDTEN